MLNRNVVLAKKKIIYIFSLNREHHVMIEGFRVARWPFSIVTWCPPLWCGLHFEAGRACACGAVAILNRNVVFRCGAGCILKLGVCVCVWRGGHFG